MNHAVLLDSAIGFAVGDNGTILKSTDAGASWTALTSGTASSLHGVYFFDPNQGVTVGDNGLILRTTDGGGTWQAVASGVSDALRAVSFGGTSGICGGDSQTSLYSSDSGVSWQISQNGGLPGGFQGAHMLSSTTGFIAGNLETDALVENTTDGGISWAAYIFPLDNSDGGCTDIFFFNENTGIVSGILFDGRGVLARTTDGGMNWSTLVYDHAIEGIDFPQILSGFAVGWGGRILRSTDAGITWADQTSGTTANLKNVCFASDALTGIAVGDGGTIVRTTNGGGPPPSPTPTATPRRKPSPRQRPTPAPRP